MDEIRIGIAGLGRRSLQWINLLQKVPGYRITAVYDWIEPLQERALAAQALEAGKHVNSEDPAAFTMEDCWRIVVDVERTGLVYNLAEQTRFWGFVDGWRKLVREGRLGKITYAEGQYLGYYGTRHYFQDFKTGKQYTVEELPDHPEAKPTWINVRPQIVSISFDLSILLKVLDDRVTEVVAMSTKQPSYTHPQIEMADIQVALLKTEKDTVIRMLTGFNQPRPHGDHHWWQMIGTKGSLEWRRSRQEHPKVWFADAQMWDWAEADWRYERTDAPAEAHGSGHSDADYYVHRHFRDAVLKGEPLEFDLYRVMDTVAPAVLAIDSIEGGGGVLKAPDFRPGPGRPAGQMPKDPGGVGVKT